MQFGNPLVASQQFTQGQIIELGTAISPSSATALINAAITNGPFSGILIHVHNPGGATVGNGLYAQVTNAEGHTFSGALPAQPTIAALALTDYYGIIPCECAVADELSIVVVWAATPPVNTSVTAYGLTDGRPTLVRPDGRSYPLASTYATGTLAASPGPVTAVPAPPASQRLLVHSLYMNCQTAGVSANAQMTVNGVQGATLEVVGNGASNQVYDSGLLLDPATPINLTVGAAATARLNVLYDIVPA